MSCKVGWGVTGVGPASSVSGLKIITSPRTGQDLEVFTLVYYTPENTDKNLCLGRGVGPVR